MAISAQGKRVGMAVLAALIGAGALLATALPASTDQHIREIVAFEDQFPESLDVAADGTIHVGIANTGEILRVTPSGTQSSFAQIPLPEGGVMLGVASVDAGNVFAVVTAGEQSGLWRVSSNGAHVAQVAALPADSFPNDLVRDSSGRVYVTDTLGGRIFAVEVSGNTGTVETLVEDPLLLGNVENPGPVGMPIGANGILLDGAEQALYVAVSEKATLVRIELNEDGSAGDISVAVEDPALAGGDGIDLGPDGRIYVAAFAGNHIAAADPQSGEVEVVAAGEVFRFPSAAKFSPDFETLYVTNFEGGVLFGLEPGPPQTGLLAIQVSGLGPVQEEEEDGEVITPPDTGSAGLAVSR